MRATPTLICLTLTLAALAGCFTEDDPTPEVAPSIAGSAQEAGASSGPAPVAASEPFQVAGGAAGDETLVTAYPVAFETNAAKPPETREFAGEFTPTGCTPVRNVPLVGLLGVLPPNGGVYNVSDALAPGDVFSFDVQLRWTNTDESWADAHLFYAFGAATDNNNDFTGELRGEVVVNFTGQQFRLHDGQPAMVGAFCWYGQVTTPIPYTLTVTLHFAEAGVPSQTPILLDVPANATRLFVSGLALDPSQGVLSHYRIFGPDDELVCECSLSSNQAVATVELETTGAHVLLVDHTSNGFVSFALDAPPPAALRALDSVWSLMTLATSDGGAFDETVPFDLPATPLNMGAWVIPTGGEPADAGFGQGYALDVTNGRGEVVRQRMEAFAMYRLEVPSLFGIGDWRALPVDGEWEFWQDHHAYGRGAHEAHVTADSFRGQVVLIQMSYVR